METSKLYKWFRMYGWRHLVGLVFVTISLYPILFVFTNSFADFPNLANSKLIPNGFTFKHYRSLSESDLIPYFRWLFNTYKIAGIAGFLKSIRYTLSVIKPTRCIIVFDGKDGSKRRRKIYPQYKAQRKVKKRLNRNVDWGTAPSNEEESMKLQLGRLVEYIEYLPLTIVSDDGIDNDGNTTNDPTDLFASVATPNTPSTPSIRPLVLEAFALIILASSALTTRSTPPYERYDEAHIQYS